MQQKNIYIVLTRTNTMVSRLISLISGKRYTHASIALDKSLPVMYSFGRKRRHNPFIGGFCRESLAEGLFADCASLPYMIVQVKVTQEQYNKANTILQHYKEKAEQYHYNYMGLLFASIGMAYKSRRRFYCSEFVYDLLSQCGIVCGKTAAVIHPQALLRHGHIIEEGDWRQKQQEKKTKALSEWQITLKPLTDVGQVGTA